MSELTWADAVLGAAAAGTMVQRVLGVGAGPVMEIRHVEAFRHWSVEPDPTTPGVEVTQVSEYDEIQLAHDGGVETVYLTQRMGKLDAVVHDVDGELDPMPHPAVAAPLAVLNQVAGLRAAVAALWPDHALPPPPALTPWLLGPMTGLVSGVEVVGQSRPNSVSGNRGVLELRETELAVTLAGTQASHELVVEEVREHPLTTWQAGVRLPQRQVHVRFAAGNAMDAVLLAARHGVQLLLLHELPLEVPSLMRQAASDELVVRPGQLLGGVSPSDRALETVTWTILRAALTRTAQDLDDVWARPARVTARPGGWSSAGLVVDATVTSVSDPEHSERSVLAFDRGAGGWRLTSISHITPASPAPRGLA
jgi:hypothetical protein